MVLPAVVARPLVTRPLYCKDACRRLAQRQRRTIWGAWRQRVEMLRWWVQQERKARAGAARARRCYWCGKLVPKREEASRVVSEV